MGEPELGESFAFSIPSWLTLGLLALGAMSLFLVFGTFADFDRVAHVRGTVAPASGVSRLTAPQAGIVTSVLVRQGELVTQGAPLVRIASADSLPSGAGAPAQVLETFRRQQQIARAGRVAERQRAEAERQRIAHQVAELSSGLRLLRAQVTLQQERIENNERRLRNLAPLRAKGYVSDVTYQEQEETILSLRQQLAALQQREAEARHGLQGARLRLAELAAEGRRGDFDAASSQLELERGAAGAQVDAEVTLAAPVAGRVTALQAAPGMAVAAGDELAAVVQSGDRMEALLFVPSSAAGSLRPGQEVALRYDAFPYQRHGVGRGVVTEVAATTSSEQPEAPPTYRVKVRLLDDNRFPLRPDMSLSAAIMLERRSLLDWLLAPLRAQWRESRHRAAA